MPDLDRLLGADVSAAAADAAEPPDFAAIEHRGAQRRRTRTMLVAAAAAAVIAAVAAGSSLLAGADHGSPSPVSPVSPSPTLRSMPSGDGATEETIQPGAYRIPASPWSAADFTIAFPKGWSVQYGHIYHRGPGEELILEAAVVDEIYGDACRSEGDAQAVGPRVRDLVTALRRQSGPSTGRPVHTSLGGHPATRVDLRVPEDLDLGSCRLADDGVLGLQIWFSQAADNYFVLHADAVASVYVLDVGGRRQVFVAQNLSPRSAEARAELQAVLDSIRIEG
ncbi:hypothetical protein ACT8ZV_14250 [Nocardioides sp. MAHUQ-72]|uniref:hypothetical protein n=1 Tax=unclassified Nocardioides TaxID=2615069 RepID=UPI00360B7508